MTSILMTKGKNIIAVVLIAVLLFTAAFVIEMATAKVSGATGSLISKNGVWYGGAEDGASTTVNWGGGTTELMCSQRVNL